MIIDKTTYKDKEENQIGRTADLTSRPDKVLFFADPRFLFYKADTQQTHFVFPTAPAQKPKKQKEFAFLSAQIH